MINKNIKIIDLLQEYPELIELFNSMGMGCSHCMGALNETLEQGIKAHGFNLEKVMDIINNYINK